MAEKWEKFNPPWRKGGAQNPPDDPARPAIDLDKIKARYSARPLAGMQGAGGEAGDDIQFVDAESLTKEELAREMEAQGETDIQGEETGFGEEALSLFADEEDKPGRKAGKKRKKKRLKKAKARRGKAPAEEAEDELDLVDFSKPRRQSVKVRKDVLEKAVIFSAAMLMVGVLLILYYWLLIDRIEVRGNETLERADVLSTAGINVGEHILAVNTGEARKKLLENPRIKSVAIHRVYPDQLVMELVERQPVAAIAGGGSYAIVDEEGYVLSIGPDNQDLPAVYGMGSSGFQLGEPLGDLEDFNSNILLRMLEALENAGVLGDMARLDITQPLNVTMTTLDGYTVLVGQVENLDEKLANLSLVLAKLKALGYSGGEINLAVQGDPVYSPPGAEPAATAEPASTAEPEDDSRPAQSPEPDQSPGPSPGPSPSPSQAPSRPPAEDGDNFSG